MTNPPHTHRSIQSNQRKLNRKCHTGSLREHVKKSPSLSVTRYDAKQERNLRLFAASVPVGVNLPAPECVGEAETEISDGDTDARGGCRGGGGGAPATAWDNADGIPPANGKPRADAEDEEVVG